jgi:hypothetical protein
MATSNIDLLKDKKILEYPLGLSASETDKYGQLQPYMMIRINTSDKATKLKDDSVTGAVVVAANTRQGIGVGNVLRGTVLLKTDDSDMKLKFGVDQVDKTQWLVQKGMTRLDKVIILPMPMELAVSTSIQYNDNFASTPLTKLGDIMNNSAAGTISDLVSLGKNKAIAGIVNSLKSGATNEQALLAEDRLAINPKKEVMFESFGFRKFNFSFRFAPKNEAESKMVSEIIQTLRYYSLPELTSGKMFYIFPSEFEISFMLGSKDNPHIPRVTTSVLQRINVNYMPDNIWASLPNGAPLSLSMNLEFLEMELVDRGRVWTKDSPIVSGY